MTAPQITTIPTPPDSTQGRAAFVLQANAFGDDLTPFASQINAVAVQVNANAIAADSAKTLAEQARDAAVSASQGIAPPWQSGTHAAGTLAWGGDGNLYRTPGGVTGSTPPENDPGNWDLILVAADQLSSYATVAATSAGLDALLDVPVVDVSTARTLQLSDRGKDIYTNATVIIPTNASVAFPVGTVIIISSKQAGDVTITPETGVTLRWEGEGSTGQRKIENYGSVRIHKKAANTWYIGGAGLK